MKTLFRVLAIFFALGILGNLLDNEFSWLLVAVDIVCFYLGWGHGFDKGEEGLKPISKNETSKKELDFQMAEEALRSPSERFTTAQKHALICCLYVIAAGDNEVHPDELEYISKVVNVLEYWDFDEVKIVSNCLNNREMIIDVVSNFNPYQRKYLMHCMDGVIKADWEIKEIEFVYAGSILEQAGFSFDEFLTITNNR